MDKIEIINLADEPEHLEEVARWIWEEWDGKKGTWTIDEVVYRTKHSILKDRVPMTFIAKCNGQLAGCQALWNCDLKARQDLEPWGACFFVKKEFRGKGVDRALTRHSVEVARRLGYEYLYFWSEHKNYYERMKGVEYIEQVPLGFGEWTNLYRVRLA